MEQKETTKIRTENVRRKQDKSTENETKTKLAYNIYEWWLKGLSSMFMV